jgi:hypothetical protein
MSLAPWVTVLDAGPAVLAVEHNGWQWSDESGPGPLSSRHGVVAADANGHCRRDA